MAGPNCQAGVGGEEKEDGTAQILGKVWLL
jgi:hypothetical protein